MRGPIDYIVVAFKDAKFKGAILEELEKAVSQNIIDVLAIALVVKDKDGEVQSIDITNSGDEVTLNFTKSHKLQQDLVTEEDVSEVGELLEPGDAAGLLIVEHLWAKGLKKAIMDAGGRLVAEGRIHPEASAELN